MEKLLEKYSLELNDDFIYIKPNIPKDKLEKAILSYGDGLSEEDVLLFIDNTVLGSAKHGLILTDNKVSGSIELLTRDDDFNEDFKIQGRGAFYLKGKNPSYHFLG